MYGSVVFGAMCKVKFYLSSRGEQICMYRVSIRIARLSMTSFFRDRAVAGSGVRQKRSSKGETQPGNSKCDGMQGQFAPQGTPRHLRTHQLSVRSLREWVSGVNASHGLPGLPGSWGTQRQGTELSTDTDTPSMEPPAREAVFEKAYPKKKEREKKPALGTPVIYDLLQNPRSPLSLLPVIAYAPVPAHPLPRCFILTCSTRSSTSTPGPSPLFLLLHIPVFTRSGFPPLPRCALPF